MRIGWGGEKEGKVTREMVRGVRGHGGGERVQGEGRLVGKGDKREREEKREKRISVEQSIVRTHYHGSRTFRRMQLCKKDSSILTIR